ncbi:MAG: hypothetical protein ACK5U8_05015, partial [Deltaproteobacteria bacterium]
PVLRDRMVEQVKNRAPAPIQITAEQMLLEAQARAPNYAADIGKQVRGMRALGSHQKQQMGI